MEAERASQRATLEKMRNKATAALATLETMAPKWKEELALLQEHAKDSTLVSPFGAVLGFRARWVGSCLAPTPAGPVPGSDKP